MRIIYSKHLEDRLILRNIPRDLPERIFKNAEERYIDNETNHAVAIKKCFFADKERLMMVAYRMTGEEVRLITAHPLKDGQKENRLKTGRWRKI